MRFPQVSSNRTAVIGPQIHWLTPEYNSAFLKSFVFIMNVICKKRSEWDFCVIKSFLICVSSISKCNTWGSHVLLSVYAKTI